MLQLGFLTDQNDIVEIKTMPGDDLEGVVAHGRMLLMNSALAHFPPSKAPVTAFVVRSAEAVILHDSRSLL